MKGAEIGELRRGGTCRVLGFVCLVGSRGEGWCQGSPGRHGLHLVPEHRLEDGHQEVSCCRPETMASTRDISHPLSSEYPQCGEESWEGQ